MVNFPAEREDPMQFSNERNVLRIGPPVRPGEAEITPAMVEAVRKRLAVALNRLWICASGDHGARLNTQGEQQQTIR